ncbi:hypothetical protein BM477_02280 [Boudabousia marimammalium]|uniref:Guanylate cyclase domain-containing protein n=2 Tax=Boudabousia marimammalium TaxID=156892 RepID=A0A1Q5PSJ4_9ACTO|nr:hypothetical protein BM477_02280 [Boudabousia marimammalium]
MIGGNPQYTQSQLAELAGVSEQDAKDFWRAMGFRNLDADAVTFTDLDVQILRASDTLVSSGELDGSALISLLRAESQTANRLALWQLETLVEANIRAHAIDDTSARLVALDQIQRIYLLLEEQTLYAWRRHMCELLERTANQYALRYRHEIAPDEYPLRRALGFADMVSYTSTTRHLGAAGLSRLIQKFEYISRDVITSRGARIVKTIGDAVLYIADDAETATDVVCALVERFAEETEVLPVRASLVDGFVVSRSGDVFGPPVNLASRLVDQAGHGEIFTDAGTAELIKTAAWGKKYEVSPRGTVELQGLGEVPTFALKRNSAE